MSERRGCRRRLLGSPFAKLTQELFRRHKERILEDGQLLERLQHPILIEASVPKVGFGVGPTFELPALLGGCRIDPNRGQPSQMLAMLIRINDVNRFVATRESVFDERKQHTIPFFVAVEERAHMTCLVELRAGKGNGCRVFLHGVFLLWILVTRAAAKRWSTEYTRG